MDRKLYTRLGMGNTRRDMGTGRVSPVYPIRHLSPTLALRRFLISAGGAVVPSRLPVLMSNPIQRQGALIPGVEVPQERYVHLSLYILYLPMFFSSSRTLDAIC